LLGVMPMADQARAGGALSVGIGITAYALGVRHAFDADHIAAIDNTTRKLMVDGQRPISVGFWFSLGHSTVVFAAAVLLAVGVRAVAGPGYGGSGLHEAATWVGTLVSGGFLYVIAAMNVTILLGIATTVRRMRAARCDEDELDMLLAKRGLICRLIGPAMRIVRRPLQMYPIGVLFGLGFDTASEIALLVLASSAAGAGLPWYAVLCLPLLFAAGMSLMDTLDGCLMGLVYGWAVARPARKVYYNLTVTCVSVAVAVLIGTVELGGLLASRVGLSGSFWGWFEKIHMDELGFVIVGLFVLTWVAALAIWRVGRIEERWSAVLPRDR